MTLVTLAVIVVAAVAFLVAQSLKLEPSPLTRVHGDRFFSPVCGCGSRTRATFRFKVKRPLRVDAAILGPSGRPVRSLAAHARWRRGPRTLEWDGRDEAGRRAPDGSYRLEFRLLGSGRGRRIIVPTPVILDTRAPLATLAAVSPRALRLARGGAPSEAFLRVRYRANEASRPRLLVDRRPAVVEGLRPAGLSALRWDGRVRGRPARGGSHTLAVDVRDRAGNLSRPTDGVVVRVRRLGSRAG